MEAECSHRPNVDVLGDPGLAITEDSLRRSVHGSSFAVLTRSMESPVSEMEIPLCRLQLMTEVRLPMDPDVERLRGEFTNGYKRGGPCFYVSITSYSMQEMDVTADIRETWSPLWLEQDAIFEERLRRNPALERFSNKMFYVWDGNHRLKAWMPFISQCHPQDVSFHVHVNAILLKVTRENHDVLLNAMTDWNKKNQSDHVQQHWTHDLMRMRHFGLLPFDQLKVLVSEEDYASSLAEWNKPSKSKKWYHLTSNSFVNLFHEREITLAQEQAIRDYRDSLVKSADQHDLGSSADLIAKAKAAVRSIKTRLHTEFDRMLAVADPRNGENFIIEIRNHFNVYQTKPEMTLEKLQLLATAKVPGKYKERWLRWWNMSKESRVSYNFPKSPCSTDSLRPWVEIAAFWAGLEEEASNLFEKIIEDDKIILKVDEDNPVVAINRWILGFSCTLWKRVFREFFGKGASYSKGREFLTQPHTEKATKRVVLRYFYLELLPKKAIDRIDLPARFQKWSDTSSRDCIFSDYQRKTFERPHLLHCPWYLEQNKADLCLDEERALKSRCERETQELADAEGGDLMPPPDVPLTEREKRRAQMKLEKEALRLEAAEAKRKLKEQAKKDRLQRKALKRKSRPDSQLEGGISPSGSSRPTSSHPLSGKVSQLSLYDIPVSQAEDVHGDVEVINSSVEELLAKFDGLAEQDCPVEWKKIADFVKVHQGTKNREYKSDGKDPKVVDMVIFDVPEGLPVPGISVGNEVPSWNQLVVRPGESGSGESPWIHAAFDFADQWIADDGAVLVFYPDSRFISNEISSWARWANFREEMKWMVFNNLPLTKPDYRRGQTVKYSAAKLFVRDECTSENIPPSSYTVNSQEGLQHQGIDLMNDGTILNAMSLETVSICNRTGIPWRGPREKAENMFLALLDLCTDEDDVVIDLTAGTGTSLMAGRSIGRHMIGIEADSALYNEVLVPLITHPPPAEPVVPGPSRSPRKRPPSSLLDEPEVKRAPKRRRNWQVDGRNRHVLAQCVNEAASPERFLPLPFYAEQQARAYIDVSSPESSRDTEMVTHLVEKYFDIAAGVASSRIDDHSSSTE